MITLNDSVLAGKFCYAFGLNMIFIMSAFVAHLAYVLTFITISVAQNMFLLQLDGGDVQ